jgi:hypothetical protein
VEPRRVDLEALLNAHAFMRVERPPLLWEVDVLDEPFVRMLGELIVVGLRHHDVLADLTLNVSNVVVTEGWPPTVPPGDYVAVTIRARGRWGPERDWTPDATEPLWSDDLDGALRGASASYAYIRVLGPDEGSITVFVPRRMPDEGSELAG